MKISVIVPTYNEAENVRKLIPMIDSVLKDYDYEIVIVDDSSPDGTAKVAEKLAERYPVRVLRREKKLVGFSDTLRVHECKRRRFGLSVQT